MLNVSRLLRTTRSNASFFTRETRVYTTQTSEECLKKAKELTIQGELPAAEAMHKQAIIEDPSSERPLFALFDYMETYLGATSFTPERMAWISKNYHPNGKVSESLAETAPTSAPTEEHDAPIGRLSK